jgi:hypothetical protein
VLPVAGLDDAEEDGAPPDDAAEVPGWDAGALALAVDALERGLAGGEATLWPGEPLRIRARAVPAAAVTAVAATSRPRPW